MCCNTIYTNVILFQPTDLDSDEESDDSDYSEASEDSGESEGMYLHFEMSMKRREGRNTTNSNVCGI